jgi:predicted rRNA methylase YqxC with S4 and FtsJ domains
LDKLLTEAGFVQSRTEATRKIEENAVKVIGQAVNLPVMTIIVPCDLPMALGKKTKIVSIGE